MEQLISILVNNKSTTLMFFMISFAILNVTSLHKYSVESTVRLMTEKMEILPRTLFFFWTQKNGRESSTLPTRLETSLAKQE
jgi:hypothetical protein